MAGKKYGKLRTTRRKIHKYLGMTLDFSKQGKVRVDMTNYVKEIIEDFPEAIKGSITTPAADHFFDVNKEGKSLEENFARQFHISTA
eukprot:10328266-Ditylum_brightwellii.AAC.1